MISGMFEQILIMLFDNVVFIYLIYLWFLLHDLVDSFSMNVVWMFSCICMLQICYALWLFVDAKRGEK